MENGGTLAFGAFESGNSGRLVVESGGTYIDDGNTFFGTGTDANAVFQVTEGEISIGAAPPDGESTWVYLTGEAIANKDITAANGVNYLVVDDDEGLSVMGTVALAAESEVRGTLGVSNGVALTISNNMYHTNGTAENGISVIINVTDTGNSGNITVNLPQAIQDDLLDARVKEFRIVSADLEISFDEEALRQIRNTAGTDVVVNIAEADRKDLSSEALTLIGFRPVYHVTVSYTKNGESALVSQFGKVGATLNIPYSPGENETTAHLFAFYIDNQGKAIRIPGSYYDPERRGVVLTTDHFSLYGIGYQTPAIKGDFKRIASEDRLQTALKISQQGWLEGAAVVVLARADDFPDALTGVPLAKQLDAPILLTDKAGLAAGTVKEIQRLKVKTIYILGGKGAISQEIQDSLIA